MDNAKSGVLFTDQLLDKYNFVAMQLDTFESFSQEFEWQPDTYSAKNDNQELGLAFIFKSMTVNQRKIITEIANHQLQNPTEKGIKIRDLLAKCVENMLATSQKALKEYLNEAKDHKIVQERVDEQGSTWLFMSYPTQLLQKIVDEDLN